MGERIATYDTENGRNLNGINPSSMTTYVMRFLFQGLLKKHASAPCRNNRGRSRFIISIACNHAMRQTVMSQSFSRETAKSRRDA